MAGNDLPTPPFILVEGLPNFRDLGGYPIASQSGKVVRRGVVFRSSEPSQVTESGVKVLQDLKIRDVYDLRSKQELEKDARDGHGRQPKEWPGAKRIFAPVFLSTDYSPEAIARRFKQYAENSSEGFVVAYQDLLKSVSAPENEAKPYRAILKHLASPPSGDGEPPAPLLLHCTAGKDRTGVVCALILSLCGVEDEVVTHEYSLTDLGLKSRHPEFIRHLTKEPALRDNPVGAARMIGARRENMTLTLAKIREIYGSVEKCVLDLNFLDSAAEIEQLRANLVTDGGGVVVDWRAHAELVARAEEESVALARRIVGGEV